MLGGTTHTTYHGNMTAIMLIASAAIAARATRLATHDTLTQTLRDHGPRWWREFASCPYCIGWWITLATFAGGYTIAYHGTGLAQTIWVWIAAACALNLSWAALVSAAGTVGDAVNAFAYRQQVMANARETSREPIRVYHSDADTEGGD